MNIDLIYFYRPYSTNFYLYGPQKIDNNIVVNSDGILVFSSESAVFNKIDEMCASLSPDITNINIKSSVEFTAGLKMRVYTGELNAGSESPDYTDILTSINNNLEKLLYCFTSNISTSSNIFNNSLFQGIKNLIYCFSSNIANSANVFNTSNFTSINSRLTSIDNKLKQSVSPNASITDVISALNTTIDSKQDTTIVNNEVTPLAEINIDVPFEVKNLKKSDVENL